MRVRGVPAAALAALLAWMPAMLACGEAKVPPPPLSARTPSAAAVATSDGSGANRCQPDGRWAACSIVYRLERAGVVPRVDSTASPSEKALGGQPLMLKIGLSARLEVHIYPDSLARATGAATLDRSRFVSDTEVQTIRRERTLIESANIVGLLTSINAHQRERVAAALMAGPPQP